MINRIDVIDFLFTIELHCLNLFTRKFLDEQ